MDRLGARGLVETRVSQRQKNDRHDMLLHHGHNNPMAITLSQLTSGYHHGSCQGRSGGEGEADKGEARQNWVKMTWSGVRVKVDLL